MSKRVERICKWCGHKVTFDVEKHDKKIYNKAIDDFAEKLKQKNKVFDISNRMIDELAEQLKAGGDNA